jgi:hypothetical protein
MFLMLAFGAPAAQAQSWQWGRTISCDSFGGRFWPTWGRASVVGGVIDMATDEAGNVYSLIALKAGNLKVAGQLESSHGGYDVLLTSFSCEGQYRWSKVIGSGSDSDAAISVKASGESGVFVAGSMTMALPGGLHFGNDTAVAGMNKTMFLAKWDTAGNFQWLRLPQPDTMSHQTAVSLCQPGDMDLGSDGNLYLLACLTPGAYAGGSYIVSTLGAHVLKYSSSGQFLGGVALPIVPGTLGPWPFLYTICGISGLRYDGTNGRFVFASHTSMQDSITVGGMRLVGGVAFVASFDASTGAMKWLKASSPIRQQGAVFKSVVIFWDRPQVDAQGNVYLAGQSSDSGVFNGVLFRNPVQEDVVVDFVTKLDASTGNGIWTTIGRTTGSGGTTGLALTGNKVAVTGYYSDSLIYPGGLLTNNQRVDSSDAYIVQMDAATGTVQKMASLTGPSRTWRNPITADRRGNFYVTGSYDRAAQTIGTDALTLDNYYNLFIAKWGWANCSCTPAKAALVKSASVGLAQAYTYTGTGTGLDSLVWDFGDGTRQKILSGFGNAVLHNYAAAGHYTVCVTAYNESCGGSSTACLPVALAVGNIAALKDVRVYPNPATDAVVVEGAAGAKLELLNALGQQAGSFSVQQARQVISLRELPAGIYLLQITDQKGNRGTLRIAKQ